MFSLCQILLCDKPRSKVLCRGLACFFNLYTGNKFLFSSCSVNTQHIFSGDPVCTQLGELALESDGLNSDPTHQVQQVQYQLW